MVSDIGKEIATLEQQLTLLSIGKPLPQISLIYDDREISAGELIDMGYTMQGATKTITLTIKNAGIINIEISGVDLSGRYADRFNITGITPPVLLIPGAETTFDVSFQTDTRQISEAFMDLTEPGVPT